MIVGANTAEAHPVVATRIKRAHKFHGQRLIVADIRRHEMAERADIFFRPRPGTDLVWLSAVAKYAFDHGLEKKEFLSPYFSVKGSKLFRYCSAESMCILWAMGITQHAYGSEGSTAIANLLLVTGNCMKPKCGRLPASRA